VPQFATFEPEMSHHGGNVGFEDIGKAVVEFDGDRLKNLVGSALKKGIAPAELLEKGLIPGMKEVGERFARKEYFVPEVLMAAEAFYAGFDLVKPLIKSRDRKAKGKIVIGVVEGDIHDIGKNIVRVMLEASGYEIVDLGKDVPTTRFIETAVKEKPQVVALSSLMTTTMVKMGDVIQGLEKKGVRKNIKVVIGGAPVNQDFADKIGADGYAENAGAAIRMVENLLRP
jgi:corrinoid protein of di/trimethylamine methyltransferase